MTTLLISTYALFSAGYTYQTLGYKGWPYVIMSLILGPLIFPFQLGKHLAAKL